MSDQSKSPNPLPPRPAASAEDGRKLVRVTAEETTSLEGPLPPPELLAGYEKVHPGLAERIIVMAEEHGRTFRKAENRRSFSEAFQRIGGTVGTILIAGCGLALAYFLGTKGMEGAAIAAVIGAISPILIAALTNLRNK